TSWTSIGTARYSAICATRTDSRESVAYASIARSAVARVHAPTPLPATISPRIRTAPTYQLALADAAWARGYSLPGPDARGGVAMPGGRFAGAVGNVSMGASWIIFPPRYDVYATDPKPASAPTSIRARIHAGMISSRRRRARHHPYAATTPAIRMMTMAIPAALSCASIAPRAMYHGSCRAWSA